MKRLPAIVVAAAMLCLGSIAVAQVTFSGTTWADAFVTTGSSNNPAGSDLTGLDFGAAGTLVIAPANSGKGEFQSLLKFNFSNAVALFNTNYGAGNWTITGLSLTLTSNYGTGGVQPNNAVFPKVNGGNFVIEWLADNDWDEGTGTPILPTTDGVTYDSLPALLSGPHEILGTNLYTPPGNNIPATYALPLDPNMVNGIVGGGDVTFLLYAADDLIGYLFNSYSYGRGNQPLVNVTAARPLKLISGVFTNGNFHLTGMGSSDSTYKIQVLTNLGSTNWQAIGTATADDSGAIQFEDTNAAAQPQRFYRLSQ